MSDALQVLLVGEETAYLLGNVAEDVFDASIRLDRLAAYVAQPGHVMAIAVADGVVVGQARAVVHRNPDEADQLYVDNLGVAPDHQRRGVATALLRLLLEEGRRRGCAGFWVATEADNAEAIAFYRSLGLDAREMVYFEGGL
ncbi:MAG: GNAT family N-acetyltransferase [Azospirillaceae bacterium]